MSSTTGTNLTLNLLTNVEGEFFTQAVDELLQRGVVLAGNGINDIAILTGSNASGNGQLGHERLDDFLHLAPFEVPGASESIRGVGDVGTGRGAVGVTGRRSLRLLVGVPHLQISTVGNDVLAANRRSLGVNTPVLFEIIGAALKVIIVAGKRTLGAAGRARRA